LRPVVNPLGIVSAPGELAASLRTLPELLDALRQVGDDTRRMADNTAELPDVRAQLERVAEMTSVLPQMDRRMATIEEAMPVLVEVQQHLAKLPETIEGLNRGIAELVGLMTASRRRSATCTSRSSRSAGWRTESRAVTAARARGNLTGFRREAPLGQRRTLRYYSGEI
jgi:hypothetical protein